MRPVPFDIDVPQLGYRWWYLDATDPSGEEALVIIAFVGSVFSPYYRLARDRGGCAPEDFCAINIALYGRRKKRWAMTERRIGSVRRTRDLFAVGPSCVRWAEGCMHFEIKERCAPFGQRMRGSVLAEPVVTSEFERAIDGKRRHHWRPWAPLARVRVDFEHPDFRWEGLGYLDGNDGSEPLEAGFRHWDWCRSHDPEGIGIHYDVTRRGGSRDVLSIRFDEQGAAVPLETPPEHPLRSGYWGVARKPRAAASLHLVRTLEDTPFYTRSLLAVDTPGGRQPMVHESLSMDRFNRGWVRFLLPFRMPREFRKRR